MRFGPVDFGATTGVAVAGVAGATAGVATTGLTGLVFVFAFAFVFATFVDAPLHADRNTLMAVKNIIFFTLVLLFC